jgi:hypothetical protein
MTEAKKARAKSAKTAQKADLLEIAAAAPAETVESLTEAARVSEPVRTKVLTKEAGAALRSVREQGDVLRQAMSEAAAASARGALEFNDKIIDALNIQSNAAFDLWRTALDTRHLPEAFTTQTNATRQAYETASAQWKDAAETAARWLTLSLEPLQSALNRQAR